jgi:hypothetical protein
MGMKGRMDVNEGMKGFEQKHLSIGCKVILEREKGAPLRIPDL